MCGNVGCWGAPWSGRRQRGAGARCGGAPRAEEWPGKGVPARVQRRGGPCPRSLCGHAGPDVSDWGVSLQKLLVVGLKYEEGVVRIFLTLET